MNFTYTVFSSTSGEPALFTGLGAPALAGCRLYRDHAEAGERWGVPPPLAVHAWGVSAV